MRSLITGATGNVGPHIVGALVRRAAEVRVLARDVDRAKAVLPPEVAIVAGDLDDSASVRAALRGVDALFVLTPHGPDMGACQKSLVGLAVEAGVRVVKLSGTSAAIRPDGPDACRQHWEVEEQLRGCGLPHVVLRPNAFMQPLLRAMIAGARETGTIFNPIGDAGLSMIDCADIGDVAAEVLTSPSFDGQTLTLTGPSAPTYAELGNLISRHWKIPVQVVDTTPQQAGEAVLARGGSPWSAEHLVEMFTLFRDHQSEYVTEDVRRVIGRPARPVEQFLRAEAA
jgi:uncharacterized protein YbjT (DUF2867 family)